MFKRLFIVCILVLALTAASYAAETPERIVSLAPSVTEMLFALHVEDRLVGVTDYCDYPPEARGKPHIGGMANPSLEAVVAARPDLVILTTDGNPKAFEERLKRLEISTYVMRERRVIELPRAIRNMGEVVGAQRRAEELARHAQQRLDAFRKENRPRGRALFVVWPEPLMVAGPGTAIADAFDMLGFKNIASDAGTSYPKFSLEAALRRAPEYIFIGKSMGINIEEVSGPLVKRLASTPAVRNGHVYYASDGIFRFGLRVLDGIEELKNMVDTKKDGQDDR